MMLVRIFLVLNLNQYHSTMSARLYARKSCLEQWRKEVLAIQEIEFGISVRHLTPTSIIEDFEDISGHLMWGFFRTSKMESNLIFLSPWNCSWRVPTYWSVISHFTWRGLSTLPGIQLEWTNVIVDSWQFHSPYCAHYSHRVLALR